jgi:hypothetical protein
MLQRLTAVGAIRQAPSTPRTLPTSAISGHLAAGMDGVLSAAVDGVLGSGDARIAEMLVSLLPEWVRQPPAWIAEPHPP